jgi:hypothetical protein
VKDCTTPYPHVHCYKCGSCHCSWRRDGDYIVVNCSCGTARYQVTGQGSLEQYIKKRQMGVEQ